MIFRQIFDSVSSTYTYLIASGRGREALIIDPVLEKVDQYINLLNQLDLKLVKVIDTHIHADHISGIAELRDKTNCVTVMGNKTPADVVAMRVSDEEIIKIDGIELQALYTPGHTSESFSFLMGDRVFTGDTLLIRGTGRTDFQNGDPKDSYNSIFNKLLKLPDQTLVYPAHDYKGEMVSTIIEERQFNPRLQVKSVEEYVDIMNNLNLPDPKMMDVAVPSNLKLGIDLNRQKVNNGIEPEEFNKIKKEENTVLIDLREQNEIDKEGKLDNSYIVPFPSMHDYIEKNKDSLKNKKILFYCAHGHRSTLAVQISKSYNFGNCFHLIGGLEKWKKKGLEIN
ncbi:MBL fold metallo-hydrolase [Candidatus Pelagibacter communis]|uniref:MBL fold metallo-hydrolase n=1 Tax=Pelagibacter ubique TaxID=198252 RepID=UPI00094D0150|nr:MBL fold metallo-hydrolase [Candidatus Pelagibacter ubique]